MTSVTFCAALPYFFSADALAYSLRAQVCSVETAAVAALPNGGVTDIVTRRECLIAAQPDAHRADPENCDCARLALPAAEPLPGKSFPATISFEWRTSAIARNGARASRLPQQR